MRTKQIRQRFLQYFEQHGHTRVAGSSLVPGDDPTLLFTNAGMVQFKDVFLANETRSYNRAVTAQRCVRAGGKHNDLENIGYTARHHTFFEMLGNFSFGDYFKTEAIWFAWDLLTREFGLPKDRLWVTVFEQDDEAAAVWSKEIGVPIERITRIGAKDNFWAMGDTGPCGPCSEIFYDHGSEVAGGPPGTADEDGDRYVEIWNLVFMQFNRDASGELKPLPHPSVDTGMGLERMAAVMQGVQSNYEADLFINLINTAAEILGVRNHDHKSLRVIADHIRSITFLIVDGVTPSNEGRGYVLRRIIRRAVRHGYQLGARTAFLHKLVNSLIEEMGQAYPELVSARRTVMTVLEQENNKFNETLEQGLKLLEREINQLTGYIIPGAVAFKLYDTFGFPIDLIADVIRDRHLKIDIEGFDHAMDLQRTRARAASRFVGTDRVRIEGAEATYFSGYEQLCETAKIIAIQVENHPVNSIEAGDRALIVLDRTPFYPESGGQVGDKGQFKTDEAVFEIFDTHYLAHKVIGHVGTLHLGTLTVEQILRAKVNVENRLTCAANHSVTHLLHGALKSILGDHVQQKGSLVEGSRLRFDFSHFQAVDPAQLKQIEQMVNRHIRKNVSVKTKLMGLEQAKQAGAMALFDEKYEDDVRVVEIDTFSIELCGGTHVKRSGDIGLFKLINESGIASGVRRIEALTGQYAEDYICTQQDVLKEATDSLNTTADNLLLKIKSLVGSNRSLDKQVQSLTSRLAMDESAGVNQSCKKINGISVMVLRQDDADSRALRMTVDQCKQTLGRGIVAIGGVRDEKVTIIAAVTPELVNKFSANNLIEQLALMVGGRGGGKPDLAQGGGCDITKLDSALDYVYTWVRKQ